MLSPGDVFAGYKVLGVLGSGGMGTVYRVSHPRLGREEALKTITADHAVGDGDERFRREARAAAALHHPGIVTIHEFDVTDDVPWYTMTYLDGEDLANAAGRVSVAEAGEIITRVASALDYAHGRGVVHRDIKPANVIITRLPGGRVDGVVVVDFGIARDVTVPSDLTQPFSPVGSPPYMAPEVIRGEAAGAAADQYSLAVTAFQALTGHTPFSGSTGELLAAHTTAAPPSITRHRPDLAAADPVLRRALAKDPAQRYATCGDFATALSAALAAPSRDTLVPPAPVPPASIVPPASTPTPSALESEPPTPPRNRRRMAIAAATVVVVALAATITGVNHPRFSAAPIRGAALG
ncbi:serine/threonine-protein kinase [Gordonia crocea]|uniref:serine/threonine-protein kinase n=1 Tax=Gordonia crocea TaxID=589162 RepID=UPI00137B700C|nr:serine/threonine-protein kinase [Gordonia crocea]